MPSCLLHCLLIVRTIGSNRDPWDRSSLRRNGTSKPTCYVLSYRALHSIPVVPSHHTIHRTATTTRSIFHRRIDDGPGARPVSSTAPLNKQDLPTAPRYSYHGVLLWKYSSTSPCCCCWRWRWRWILLWSPSTRARRLDGSTFLSAAFLWSHTRSSRSTSGSACPSTRRLWLWWW
jgi:hypothetical protein